MNSIKNKVFFPDASRSISDLDEYYLRDKTFGHFEDNGRVYVVTERETPRPWIQYLCNNKIRCAVSNTGMGFIYHKNDVYITKYYELENYIARNVNGKRELFVEFFDDDKVYEFFTESDDFTCHVTTGFVLYKGNVKNLNIEVKIFVPQNDPCECWNIQIFNNGNSNTKFNITAKQDLYLYNDYYDTISRCLPNHPDNSDTRRTSEPFTVGNVYYGPDSGRYGMNLFSWFTATPAWLIHGGFEEILGVKAEFNGLKLEPHVSEDWEEYKVEKLYRNTLYTIEFKKDANEKGIWVDGIKQDCNIIKSSKEKCCVVVKY